MLKLHLNIKFTDGEDIVIIPTSSGEIVDIVLHFYSNPAMLQNIAENGAKRIREIYSYENQLIPRIRILEKELERKGEAQDE